MLFNGRSGKKRRERVFELLEMVTHDNNIAAYSQRTIHLLDGRIV